MIKINALTKEHFSTAISLAREELFNASVRINNIKSDDEQTNEKLRILEEMIDAARRYAFDI